MTISYETCWLDRRTKGLSNILEEMNTGVYISIEIYIAKKTYYTKMFFWRGKMFLKKRHICIDICPLGAYNLNISHNLTMRIKAKLLNLEEE